MSYKNIVATIGTYEKDGQTKYVNRTVGKFMSTQNGDKIVLDASFNPAGCLKKDDGSVWLSLFEPRDNQHQGGYGQQPQQAAPQQQQAAPYTPPPQQPMQQPQQAPQKPPAMDSFEDDIPFR